MKNEVYSLTLKHYIDDDCGRYEIDEPLVVNMVFDASHMPVTVCLNYMFDKLRKEMLRRAAE